jgi:hypothetical protein
MNNQAKRTSTGILSKNLKPRVTKDHMQVANAMNIPIRIDRAIKKV